ncbi:hypothetical protein GUJ93_ZPchr0007g5288 [Zizania palustris]|uniref:Uncharacterized protein n=1 Tax=Zizania palustris TaxID=103762 RepID=A0A8J5SNM4_ZIZPA|nr:hypothetical protein GUJ93_ZPchr0007g5288 [Zizania palustris]
MASLVPLLLLTAFLSAKPSLCYINPGARLLQNVTTPAGRGTYIVLVEPPPLAHGDGEDGHRRWHESFLPPSKHANSNEPRLVHSYSEVFTGFAARLTEAELDAVSKKPGFLRAFPDQTLQLMTTHTPEFLGLKKHVGFWRDAGYGKGVIVGLLDSGIHASHPSFDDRGVPPPPSRWKGSCRAFAARCNNKLIGAKSFISDEDAGDRIGHGTHTSSTVAGNFVDGAAMDGHGMGTAAGIAPGAHIAMYKVCSDDGCQSAALLAGLDEAIKDGVDVLSLSLGGDQIVKFDEDPIAIGAFSAVSKGIVVVGAAGNYGPELSSLNNEAPWLLTVAAGSVDRHFSAVNLLGNGKLIDGESLSRVRKMNSSSKSHPLLYSEEQRSCWFSDKGIVDGKIVVCQVWSSLLQNVLVNHLRRAGAAGVVLINDKINGYTTVLRDFGPDVVQVTVADGDILAEYATSANSTATITFKKTLLGVRPAPTVASFSSRGPSTLNPGVLKPDILAPGLNILAAWPPHDTDKVGESFKVLSGTSMATPHVSGVAALVKSAHPEWSPAAIKSAIMTSSDAVNSTGGPILDELHSKAGAYLTGAGHVNPMRAAHPGLVYDIGVIDYAGYICELLGDRALAIIMRNTSLSCENLVKVPEPQLNYPTITVPVRSTPLTVNRTVTNVGPAQSTYTVKVKMAGSVTVRVWPETLVFSKAREKKTFTVTVSGKIGEQEVVEGSLSWVSVSGKYVVRSSVVAISGSPHAHRHT